MNIASLDLNLLTIFEALWEEQGVGRAARRVGLTQPALSNALRRLRASLDDPLFVRVGQAMAPTAKARALSGPVLEALATIRSALAERPAFDPSVASVTFRLMTVDFGELILFRSVLSRVREQAPHVSIQIRRSGGLFDVPAADLAAGTVDLALGLFPTPPLPGSGLVQAFVAADDLVAIVDRRSFRAKTLSIKAFLARPQVRVNVREGPGLIDDALAARGLARRVAVSCPTLLSVPSLVEGTDLVAVVPRALAAAAANVSRLRILPLPIRTPPLRWSLAWHERTHAQPAHAWFRSQCLAGRERSRHG